MRIRNECIGMKFNVTAPNGVNIDVTIEDNVDRFQLYKLLKLDVFDIEFKKSKVVEVVPLTNEKVVEVLTEMITPKKKHNKNASNKGN